MTKRMGLLALPVMVALSAAAHGEDAVRDYTCFQAASPYRPELDIGSDVAIVYGVNASFADRVAQWRAKGYTAGMMTGIAWGDYGDYYVKADGSLKEEEIQTSRTGRLFMHGHSKTVGYNVPSDAYVAYIQKKVEPAVDAGVCAIFLEEPEYWAETGWSEGFKKEWEAFYGEPWQAPDSNVDAQYRASRLKYELYYDALREVTRHIKARAREQGKTIECHVPTHSLINYAHWRIVSPESHLMDIDAMDGYIAQVWTGTARTPNLYRGVLKERTFETAFFEYGQMLAMVRPTGRKVWFLADPIEDNPKHSWNDYRRNYECTVIASLMWPEVHRFEVMPWPRRIFQGTYPVIDLDTKSGEREGIPADYATEVLTVINALNDMNQPDVEYDTGTRGIGIVVSDTMMFQRANPHPSEAGLSSFYGLALPLLKHGIPLDVVQLEMVTLPNTLAPYKAIILTYEGQKPLKAAYHEAIEGWVRGGGCLLYVGDGADLYHNVREWWNHQGETEAKAHEDLFARLGITRHAYNEPYRVGKGYVRIYEGKPRQLARYPGGAERVVSLVQELLACAGEALRTQHYLKLRRGPYVIASVLEESISEAPLVLEGAFVDLLDARLPCAAQVSLQPGERALLYDLGWLRGQNVEAHVVAAAARIRDEALSEGRLRFTARGPRATTARARVLLPRRPTAVRCDPGLDVKQEWDDRTSTLWLEFPNQAADVHFDITF